MESGSAVTVSSTRKENHLKRQKANKGDEDKISNLPEALISHILSFLPTKDAVRTCVLSKSWINHWTSITKLDLDDSMFYSPKIKTGGEQHFINFVNRTLILAKAFSWESVSLVIVNKYDASLLNLWISGILNHRIKNLSIDSCVEELELPFSPLTSHSLFNSMALEELVLKMWNCSTRVPNAFVHFGKLKLLKFSGIVFTFDSVNNLELSLPVLNEFEMINCIWLSANGVTLKAPTLEKVLIRQNRMLQSPEPHNSAIKFSALHLQKFTIWGYITQPIVLLDPSSVHNAFVHIIAIQYKNTVPEAGSRAVQLLKQFTQVKCLRFVLVKATAQSNVADLPLFGMLSHLELFFVTGAVLLGLLLKSPILKTLFLKGISKFNEELLNSATVPDCLASTLQVVKFEYTWGVKHELCIAKFIMENGLVLKRMSYVANHWKGKPKAIEEFKEKVLSFKKGCPFAIVKFSYN